MARPKMYPSPIEGYYPNMIFGWDIIADAWEFAEWLHCIEQIKNTRLPSIQPYGARTIVDGDTTMSFSGAETRELRADEIRAQMSEWERCVQRMMADGMQRFGSAFVRDIARVMEWIEGGRRIYDEIGAVAYALMRDFETAHERAPTISELKAELRKRGLSIRHWSRWVQERPMFKKLNAAKRGPDAKKRR